MIEFGQGFKKYLSNTTWLLGGRVLRMIGAFCVSIYVFRYLGPDNLGLLTYSGMLVGLFMVFGSLGLREIITRELVNHPDQKDVILGTVCTLQLFGIISIWAVIGGYLYFFESDPLITLLIVIFSSSRIFHCVVGIENYFDSIVQSKYAVMQGLFATFVTLATRLYLINIEASVVYFVLTFLLESCLSAAGLLFFYHKQGNSILLWKWSKTTAGNLLRNSWPFVLSGVAVAIYMRIDQVMIKEILGIYEVGIYAVAVTLSEAWYFVPILITSSLFPAVLNAKKRSSELYTNRLSHLYQLMFWMALSVAIITMFVGKFIVPFLYGEAFVRSTTSLCIHIWAGIFVAVGGINKAHLLAENLQIYLTISFGIGAVINIVLNFLLIEKYGIEGAAISTVISYAYASFFGLLVMKKTRHVCVLLMKSLFNIKPPDLRE